MKCSIESLVNKVEQIENREFRVEDILEKLNKVQIQRQYEQYTQDHRDIIERPDI
jgi:hypothetical protein